MKDKLVEARKLLLESLEERSNYPVSTVLREEQRQVWGCGEAALLGMA